MPHVLQRRLLTTVFFAFYLAVAAGLPLADALAERAAAVSIASGEQGAPKIPAQHGDDCALCALLERFSSPLHAWSAPAPTFVQATSSGWPRPADSPGTAIARWHSARAPPLG